MNTERVGDVLVLALRGRLDTSGVNAVEAAFQRAVVAHRGPVLVDLTLVPFVGSLALRMLLTALKAARPHGELCLACLQPQVAEIFRRSRFDTLFTIYPDRASALAAVRS